MPFEASRVVMFALSNKCVVLLSRAPDVPNLYAFLSYLACVRRHADSTSFSSFGRPKSSVVCWEGHIQDMLAPSVPASVAASDSSVSSVSAAAVTAATAEDDVITPVFAGRKTQGTLPLSVLEALQSIDLSEEGNYPEISKVAQRPPSDPTHQSTMLSGLSADTSMAALQASAERVAIALQRCQAALEMPMSASVGLDRAGVLLAATQCVQAQCSLAWLMTEISGAHASAK